MSIQIDTRMGDAVSCWPIGAENAPKHTHMLVLQIEERDTRAAAGTWLTSAEARHLAAELTKLADEIEGRE